MGVHTVDNVVLLGAQDASAVPSARVLRGATVTGPTTIGAMHVCGSTNMPDGLAVTGARYQVASKRLAPGESYQAEPGVMMYMSDGMRMQARFAGWRLFSGEGFAKLRFTNTVNEPGYLGLTPNMPMALVLPVDVGSARLNCKRGAFMAGDESVRVYPKLLPARSFAACCCGGMPPVIQHLSGSGTALLAGGGTIMMKQLDHGEVILADTNSVVAFTEGVGYDVKTVGNLVTCCCSGEGCFNTELTGPGTVYLQTLSYEKLITMLVNVKGGNQRDKKNDGRASGGAPSDSQTMER